MTRLKMPRETRAKQFMPFAALKGFEEALEKKEKIVVPKAELCDDYKEELDYQLSQMHCGDMISVIYFSNDSYVRITGILSKIQWQERWIQVVRTKIYLHDIYALTHTS
ncbi:MAG: YolD-like family protein [Eubacterium sp.]